MKCEMERFLVLLDLLICMKHSSATTRNLVNDPETNLRAINFGETVVDATLNAGVFSKTRVSTINDCALNCVIAWNCISYNFHTIAITSSLEESNCELSNRDRFSARAYLKHRRGSFHRGIKTNCENTKCGNNEICEPNYRDNTARCVCIPGYHRQPCEPIRKNCKEVFQVGHNVSGVYTILPDDKEPFNVTCDMTTDGGGWTLLQRRHNKNIDFYRGWKTYKDGFGNLHGNFWLGNDKIHRLTTSQEMVLRFDLEDFEGNKIYAVYQNVTVLDESSKYRLYFGEYTGTAGDSLRTHYGQAFSTKGTDNDNFKDNCAVTHFGGWWYNSCHYVNINGLYLGKSSTEKQVKGMSWKQKNHYSMKTTEMKVRPKL